MILKKIKCALGKHVYDKNKKIISFSYALIGVHTIKSSSGEEYDDIIKLNTFCVNCKKYIFTEWVCFIKEKTNEKI